MNRFFKIGITLITVLVFADKLTAQDTVKLTWLADRFPGKSYLQQPYKSIILQSTNGKEFTINWGDGAIETKTSDNDKSIYKATELNHTYDKAGEYTVIIASNDTNCRFTYFDCSNKKLINLDLTGCSALTILWCDNNQLTNLNLTECSALTELNCRYNHLTNLDLSDCSALKELDCSDNHLTNLDLNAYSSLTSLECNNNQLTNLNLSGCISLEHLQCYSNQLLLSEIFAANLLINNEDVQHFDLRKQNLDTRTVMRGEELFAEQSIFNGIFTSYVVIKDEDYDTYFDYDYPPDDNESENDYTVIDGKITFNNLGKYSVTMSNEAIMSVYYYSDYPETIKVRVEIIVEDINED
ncbi:MAG: hypothetical protein LBN27_03415 [Prevotellaceae bacterium]|jgi:hypothetical protein|nr:hypothetical protein [Prevotellaceae bacterium]